ncbi:MAG: AzlD domain-containing protein [Eubacteriales bacterium]|jgi:branched-subunit amino acid transport protein
MNNIYLALAIMALTIYAIRVLPFLFIRKPIRNRFIRSFLYYVPYVTLAVMTFPAILYVTDNIWAGAAALVAGIIAAWFSRNLFVTAITCCIAIFIVGLI